MATTWSLDPTHSELHFKVKHMMITNVTGSFSGLSGSLESENDDFSGAAVTLTVPVSSINTGNDQRDGHLKSPDFFDVEANPEMQFVSSSFEKSGDDYVLKGTLTLKGISAPVTLQAEFGGINTDPWGNLKAGFSVSGKINRKDWGLNWNAALETGGVLVSEEVRLSAEVQFVKQA